MIKHNKESQNKKRKDWIFLLSIGLLTVVVLYFIPTKADKIIQTSLEYLKQMSLIFPAVLILMGLFSVWISQDFVISHLGDRSGLKGIMISFLLGALPTGPVYVAFPLAQALRQKGASYTNIVIFLSA
ncbi:MAG: hypothetical protein R6U84_02400, partial [Candidatus Cloacimonadales bacterium]